jgi:hypothetical protein
MADLPATARSWPITPPNDAPTAAERSHPGNRTRRRRPVPVHDGQRPIHRPPRRDRPAGRQRSRPRHTGRRPLGEHRPLRRLHLREHRPRRRPGPQHPAHETRAAHLSDDGAHSMRSPGTIAGRDTGRRTRSGDARRAGQPLWPGVHEGSSLGRIRPPRFTCTSVTLVQVKRQVLAAFWSAFRPLHPGTNLLPRRKRVNRGSDRPGRRMKASATRPEPIFFNPRDTLVRGRCPPSTARAGGRAGGQITQCPPSRRQIRTPDLGGIVRVVEGFQSW